MIARVCSGDKMRVEIGEEQMDLEVSSGIRQGCTVSATLFKVVTYQIYDGVGRVGKMSIGDIRVGSLF